MIRLRPKTMAGRMLLVLLIGLTAAQLIGLAIYSGERYLALTTQGGRNVAERIAIVVRTFEDTEIPARQALARSLWAPGFSIDWAAQSAITEEDRNWTAGLIRAAIGSAVGGYDAERIRVVQPKAETGVTPPRPLGRPGATGPGPMFNELQRRHMREMGMPGHMFRNTTGPMRHMMQAWQSGRILEVSVALTDGSWLNFAVLTVPPEPFWSLRLFLSFGVMILAVIALSIWAVRRATQPLAVFAQAAERLGANVNTPPVSEAGASEVRRLGRAFNDMQRRIQTFVRERTQMLAAISHDLRTPITRLRLRADFVEDEGQRQKMLDDLAQMESMIADTLSFAREDISQEPQRPFDLAVLLQDLCDDAADAGHRASYHGAAACTFQGRLVALKRVFTNLIDNAIKYGSTASVSLAAADDAVVITVDDEGPGIPAEQRENVFAPFYRLEGSRSRDTGGVGLGLASVRTIIRAHGGDVVLANREKTGLRVTVTLPRNDRG